MKHSFITQNLINLPTLQNLIEINYFVFLTDFIFELVDSLRTFV